MSAWKRLTRFSTEAIVLADIGYVQHGSEEMEPPGRFGSAPLPENLEAKPPEDGGRH